MSRGGAKDEWLYIQTLIQRGTLEATKIFTGNTEDRQKHHITHKHRHIVGESVV